MGIVITFFGADYKCGCSQVSQCVAEKLASVCADKTILLIHTENKIGDDYSPQIGESIEHIEPYIKEKLYDSEEILSRSHYYKNLHIIGGTSGLGSTSVFNPDMSQSFIVEMKKFFDYIICDAGANIDNGLSLGALFTADTLYIVFTQNESALRRFEWMRCLLEKLGLNINNIIINKYTNKSSYDSKYFAERLSVPFEKIKIISKTENGEMAELLEKSLLGFRNKKFAQDIEKIINEIISNHSIC